MAKYIYELPFKVRDYECDLQGIVNNANYQHYLEHTRHEFLTSVGEILRHFIAKELIRWWLASTWRSKLL